MSIRGEQNSKKTPVSVNVVFWLGVIFIPLNLVFGLIAATALDGELELDEALFLVLLVMMLITVIFMKLGKLWALIIFSLLVVIFYAGNIVQELTNADQLAPYKISLYILPLLFVALIWIKDRGYFS